MVAVVLTGRSLTGFTVNETTGGGATSFRGGKGVGLVLIGLAGYVTPPLLGLAGTTLVLDGKSWSVLWASLVLLVGAFLEAADFFTMVVTVLVGVGIGAVAVAGGADLQAGVAVGLVWLMLLGGVRSLSSMGFGQDPQSDPARLAADTWIPTILWVALFWFVAIVCLWLGARRLLGL